MPATGDKTSTRKILLRAMHYDDALHFRDLLRREGSWPMDSDWSDYELLLYAIKHNHRRIAHILLDEGARASRDVTRKFSTPLHYAAAKKTSGWSRLIARLLALGACVAQKNSNHQTSLHLAFNARAPDEIVDMLLRAHLGNSTENVFNKDFLGFIHVACTRPHLDVVRELIEADPVLVNCQVSKKSDTTHAGFTPLHFAVEHGRLEIAEFLLRHGADIYRQNVERSSPLHLALELGNIEMIDLLLCYDKFKINKVNNNGLSHFMAACAGSDESLVPAYLHSASSSGSSPSALVSSQVHDHIHEPQSGYTPLHFAVEFGRARTAELLLSRGADCCALAVDNLTAHVLARKGCHEAIACLLDKRCRVYQPKLISAARYNTIFDEDEQGNARIRFERNAQLDCGDFYSSESENSLSSGDDSVGCVDIAMFSHDNLVSYFMKDDESSLDEEYDIATLSDEILQSLDNLEDSSQTVALDLSRYSRHDFDETPKKLTRNDTKDLADFSYSDSFSSQKYSAADQFFMPNKASHSFSSMTSSRPLNLMQIPAPPSPQDLVRIPEEYSISRSSLAPQNFYDFTVDSHTSESALSRGSSFVRSYLRDSDINDSYQANFNRNASYRANSHSSNVTPQRFEQIDYSGFFNAPSCTSIDNVNNN